MSSSKPTCPGCGASFSHDRMALRCKKCHLPDEVAVQGPKVITAWKKQKRRQSGVSKRQLKKRLSPSAARPNKHGRVGVKRAKG